MTVVVKQKNGSDQHWQQFAKHIVQHEADAQRIYVDWTASGRLYAPIEQRLSYIAGGFMANTHTEESLTGRTMTHWYHEAVQRIKRHVNANEHDVLLSVGSGMTGALSKLIRMLGWWVHEQHRSAALAGMTERPLVYITHREHHSNQTMWLESLAEVRIIPNVGSDEIDLAWLAADLARESARKTKVASVTAASNVTGVFTPYHDIARLMHQANGLCFVDFAASAPYVDINMHPNETDYLDAMFFSPHKFLGGPGSNGVLIFNGRLYHNQVPEQPGGGTVIWTNPWGQHRFVTDIEQRESGGTPGILQTIKTALAVQLKEQMGVAAMMAREHEINVRVFARLSLVPGLQILSSHHTDRLSIFSMTFDRVDYHEAVAILSERYSVDTRGGCACAGTYGHILLGIDQCMSESITAALDDDHQQLKPGWVRVSFHPTMSDAQVDRVLDALCAVADGTWTEQPLQTVSIPELFAPL